MSIAETKTCQNCKLEFTIAPEDFAFYTKIAVPSPTFCPDCRMQRRLSHRNERHLYPDTCDLCGKKMLSMYAPEKSHTVYCPECWHSDKWDPSSYGRDYDFGRPFFTQFAELQNAMPKIALIVKNTVNADFANYALDSKDLYLAFSAVFGSERIFYSRIADASKDIFDSLYISKSEKCYELVDGSQNYNCHFSVQARNSTDSYFLYDCVGCQNCFMSANLRNKQFVFRNKQYTPEKYKEELAKINLGGHQEITQLRQEFKDLYNNSLHKFASVIKTINSTGNNLENAKDVYHCFDSYDVENVRYSARTAGFKDSADTYGGNGELIYESVATGIGSYNYSFTNAATSSSNSHYLDFCSNCSNLFGCAGLKKKEYQILNKQYSKEAFEKLRQKIVEQMMAMPYVDKKGRVYKFGEYFPAELSPFAYNESLAEDFFPMSKDQIIAAGLDWREPTPSAYSQTMKAGDLPTHIKDVTDSVIKEIVGCQTCGRAFKFIKVELEFLRSAGFPLPRNCFDCRHRARAGMRLPMKLWHRGCQCVGDGSADGKYKNAAKHSHGKDICSTEFETAFAPGRPEVIYCDQCYQSEII